MNVTRVEDGNRSWIEPPLDQSWDDLKKLRWKAAVVEHDSGCPVRVNPAPESGEFMLSVGGSGTSFRFHEAWTYMNGVRAGAAAMRGVAA